MPGAEYLTPEVLRALRDAMAYACAAVYAASRTELQGFLKSLNPASQTRRPRSAPTRDVRRELRLPRKTRPQDRGNANPCRTHRSAESVRPTRPRGPPRPP
jgi:hypothetical protein